MSHRIRIACCGLGVALSLLTVATADSAAPVVLTLVALGAQYLALAFALTGMTAADLWRALRESTPRPELRVPLGADTEPDGVPTLS